MIQKRCKTENVPLKMKNIGRNLVKHACQKKVAMETSNFVDKGQ